MGLIFLRYLLAPLSLLYGGITWLRNKLYDSQVFASTRFDLPTIVVGNLSMGGTGKTPHVEYLIRLLSPQFKVATLSRGYGRQSKGYILADRQSSSEQIGDEPRQFRQKFDGIEVAVDEKRVHGIQRLLVDVPDTEVVLLDDAFQHRAVQPGFSILLTEYDRPYYADWVVPSGRLREWSVGKKRANLIVVTKCPINLSDSEKATVRSRLAPLPHQQVLFSHMKYGQPIALTDAAHKMTNPPPLELAALLVTGIAQPDPLLKYLKKSSPALQHLKLPDHYRFTQTDAQQIQILFDNFAASEKIILTTEKDAMRLSTTQLTQATQHLPIFYIPIEVAFQDSQEQKTFHKQLLDYVKEDKRDS